jgi:hypothetical protein
MASGRLVDYLGQGTAASRPASLSLHTGALGLWYATDTSTLSVWDGAVWADVTSGGGGGVWGAITGTLASQTDLKAALDAKAPLGQLAGINAQTGTAYTLALTDAGKDVQCGNAAAVALTVPPNSAVAFPIGTWLLFSQTGAGIVTATAGAGVTINAASGVATTAQYDMRGLEKVATDTWRVI